MPSEMIVCPINFKICDDSKIMHKMIPARNPNPNFPIFPNNANPSNSVAIGGVFDITTRSTFGPKFPAGTQFYDNAQAFFQTGRMERHNLSLVFTNSYSKYQSRNRLRHLWREREIGK